jgi:hypothetical protein
MEDVRRKRSRVGYNCKSGGRGVGRIYIQLEGEGWMRIYTARGWRGAVGWGADPRIVCQDLLACPLHHCRHSKHAPRLTKPNLRTPEPPSEYRDWPLPSHTHTVSTIDIAQSTIRSKHNTQ